MIQQGVRNIPLRLWSILTSHSCCSFNPNVTAETKLHRTTQRFSIQAWNLVCSPAAASASRFNMCVQRGVFFCFVYLGFFFFFLPSYQVKAVWQFSFVSLINRTCLSRELPGTWYFLSLLRLFSVNSRYGCTGKSQQLSSFWNSQISRSGTNGTASFKFPILMLGLVFKRFTCLNAQNFCHVSCKLNIF